MKTNKITAFGLMTFCCAWLAVSCSDDKTSSGQKPDSPVSGYINVSIDESLKPFGDAEVKTFTQIYAKAHINSSFKSEASAFDDLNKDTARLIIIPRKLTDKEEKYYADKKKTVKQVLIAYDAIALIINKSNPDSTLNKSELEGIMNGTITKWNQLKGKAGKIQVVFDNPMSSTAGFMKQRFHLGDTFPSGFFAKNSNQEVIDYVQKTPEAIGLIGLSWIGNEDSVPNSFMKKIKVMALSPPDTAKDAEQAYYLPYQAWVKTRYYPLVRDIYAVSLENFQGLGSGFIDFMAGQEGQITAQRVGVMPATPFVRMVKLKKK